MWRLHQARGSPNAHTGIGFKCSTDGGPAFPNWTFGFKQSSFTPIARVLRHLTLQHFQVTIAFTAGCCPLGLSAPGQPVTQEHSSKFLLVAPGISSCVTWRTLAAGRRSRIYPRETYRACRCSFRSLEPTRCRSLAAESLRQSSVPTDSYGVVAPDVLRQV